MQAQRAFSTRRRLRSLSGEIKRSRQPSRAIDPQGSARESEDAMKSLATKVQRFLVSEDGPTAVEYAVMLALIVIVC